MFKITDSKGTIRMNSVEPRLIDGVLSAVNKRSEAGIKASGKWSAALKTVLEAYKIPVDGSTVTIESESCRFVFNLPDLLALMDVPVMFTRIQVREHTGAKPGKKAKPLAWGIVEVEPALAVPAHRPIKVKKAQAQPA